MSFSLYSVYIYQRNFGYERAAVSHDAGKSQMRIAGGWPIGQASVSGAMGSLQTFSRRVDTLSVLSPICAG